MSEQPEDRATEQPEVATAPAEPPRPWHRGIPAHLGRARTSTVVLAVLFLAIGALYLNVRPDVAAPATPGGGGGVEQPADPTTTVPTNPTTTEPGTPEPAPTTTEPEPTGPAGDTPPTTTSGVPPTPGTTAPATSPPG